MDILSASYTILPASGVVIINNIPLSLASYAGHEAAFIRWNAGKGLVAFTAADRAEQEISGATDWKRWVEPWHILWQEEKKRLEDKANRPPTPEVQQAAMLAAFTAAIQNHLDEFAQTRNYDGIMSAATYATSTVSKFRAEGQYAVEARDATWATAYAILDAVLAGQRPMPTMAEVIAELPPLAWPEV